MTNQLTSKFSLYDILSMILPGCLWLWCGKIIFSNSDWAIVQEVEHIIENWSDSHDKIWIVAVFLAAGYIVGLLAEIMIGEFWRQFIVNRPYWITRVYNRKINKEEYRNIKKAKGTTAQEQYYFAYEYVRQNGKISAISIVESQIAMLRNTRWSISILVGLLIGQATNGYCCGILAGLVVWSIMFAFALLRIQKEYEMVFDSYEFIIDVENSKRQ